MSKTKWVETMTVKHGNNIVHEIKCPNCGYKVTYHNDKIPRKCYVCETVMEV